MPRFGADEYTWLVLTCAGRHRMPPALQALARSLPSACSLPGSSGGSPDSCCCARRHAVGRRLARVCAHGKTFQELITRRQGQDPCCSPNGRLLSLDDIQCHLLSHRRKGEFKVTGQARESAICLFARDSRVAKGFSRARLKWRGKLALITVSLHDE
jgi:hypothetical protein